MKTKFFNWWNRLPIKSKIGFGSLLSLILILLAIMASFWQFHSYLNSFTVILDSHSENQQLRDAFSEEQNTLKKYAWDRKKEYRENYETACSKMEIQLNKLSTDCSAVSRTKYLETMAILNGYEGYHKQVEELLSMDISDENFIDQLYLCYNTESYINTYIDRLINTTLSDGSQRYEQELESTQQLPFLWIVLAVFMITNVLLLIRYFFQLFARPMLKMADVAKEISRKNYAVPDVTPFSQDEMGNLIREFNHMKHSTVSYIEALQEKNEIEKKLHEKEILQLQAEQRMNEMKMQLLQSQINPHFLFNTLNIISGMARIEDADNTSEMTQRLSQLFRYNLKTDSKIVAMTSEINIAKDYFYIQKRRFGERIRLEWKIQTDPALNFIPAFTLQPLLENAILHGLSPKEEGGIIKVHIYKKDEKLHLHITDSGAGITRERLNDVRADLFSGKCEHIGIGVANVKSRFDMIYPGSTFLIMSKQTVGTSIWITWDPAAANL